MEIYEDYKCADMTEYDKTEAKLEHGVLKIIAPKIHKEKEQSKKLIVK